MTSGDSKSINPALVLYSKNTLSNLNQNKILSELNYRIPGNNYVKNQLLLLITQAYANKDFKNTSAIMLVGNSGVGKSTIIKNVADLVNIPLVRFDLETIVDVLGTEKPISSSICESIFYDLYETVTPTLLNTVQKKLYVQHKKKVSKDIDNGDFLILRERPNAEFTMVEFDNVESLLVEGTLSNNYFKSIQSGLIELLKTDLIISSERSTKNFIYVFSSNFNNSFLKKDAGFCSTTKKNEVNINTLQSLGYSRKFTDLLSQIILLKDLNAQDFEHHLSKKESFLQQSISGLANNYGVNIILDKSALQLVSQYLVDTKQNLRGIRDVTRKLLAPQYLSPLKGTKIVIDSVVAKERLYS
jgi:ATP-dependent protease HslVU (ClpYQ) ATPase subunit